MTHLNMKRKYQFLWNIQAIKKFPFFFFLLFLDHPVCLSTFSRKLKMTSNTNNCFVILLYHAVCIR